MTSLEFLPLPFCFLLVEYFTGEVLVSDFLPGGGGCFSSRSLFCLLVCIEELEEDFFVDDAEILEACLDFTDGQYSTFDDRDENVDDDEEGCLECTDGQCSAFDDRDENAECDVDLDEDVTGEGGGTEIGCLIGFFGLFESFFLEKNFFNLDPTDFFFISFLNCCKLSSSSCGSELSVSIG